MADQDGVTSVDGAVALTVAIEHRREARAGAVKAQIAEVELGRLVGQQRRALVAGQQRNVAIVGGLQRRYVIVHRGRRAPAVTFPTTGSGGRASDRLRLISSSTPSPPAGAALPPRRQQRRQGDMLQRLDRTVGRILQVSALASASRTRT